MLDEFNQLGRSQITGSNRRHIHRVVLVKTLQLSSQDSFSRQEAPLTILIISLLALFFRLCISSLFLGVSLLLSWLLINGCRLLLIHDCRLLLPLNVLVGKLLIYCIIVLTIVALGILLCAILPALHVLKLLVPVGWLSFLLDRLLLLESWLLVLHRG